MNITKEELKNIQADTVIEFAETDWRVLAKTADTVLIISEKVITKKPYNNCFESVTWEKCTLRKWLNEDFYSKFTDEEKAMIAETRVITIGSAENGTTGGNDTVDKIFLLSLDEVKEYFSDNESRAKGSWWWLRSPGFYQGSAAGVFSGGSLNDRGRRVDLAFGVRPALNLKF